jgi:uncharacterized repeat protein (TIGR01451 family)
MKSQSKRSALGANLLSVARAAIILAMAATNTARAKSLYLLSDVNADPPIVQVYNIAADGSLTLQAEHTIPQHGLGPVDLAIDSISGYLFVVYKGSSVIQVIDARTMTDRASATVPGTINLTGIVYDYDNRAIYCIDRGINKIHAYDWDPSTETLTRAPGSPFTCAGSGAYGIALDEARDQLYVANHTNTIAVYNTSDWSPAETVSITPLAMSVAVDAANGLLYSAAGLLNNYRLTQYDLAARTERAVVVEPDASAAAITVDPATGFVYVSAGGNSLSGGDNLIVFDRSLTQIDLVPVDGSPAGLVVSSRSFGHNPLNLRKSIADRLEYVEIGDTITYDICLDNNDNVVAAANVSVVETLPDMVDFVTADGDGVFGHYDPDKHTYTWSYTSLEPGAGACLQLVVQVNANATAGTTITSSTAMYADQMTATTASVGIDTRHVPYNPFNLSTSIAGQIDYVNVGDTITYDVCFDNNDNDFAAINISITDTLPVEVNFVTADGDGVFGQYNPALHTYMWSYMSLSPGEHACLQMVVQVNQNATPGRTITNFVTIGGGEIPPATSSVDIDTIDRAYNPLNLTKDIAGTTGEPAEYAYIGQNITYNISFDNNDHDFPITDVCIVDTLPHEVSFVAADGNGVFGQYDPDTHTYTWSYWYLEPKASDCLQLVGHVNQNTQPNAIIANLVTVTSNQTLPVMKSAHILAKKPLHNPLNLSNSIAGEVGCVDIEDIITYNIHFDNNDNDQTVDNVSIVDVLPQEVDFVTADGNGIFGLYNPIAHTYTWFYPSLEPGASDCLQLVVQVNQNPQPHATITNSVTITADQTPPTTASVDVAKCQAEPLQADLSIVKVSLVSRKRLKDIMVIMKLPQGVNTSDIQHEPLVLDPGNTKARYQHVYAAGSRAKIIAVFCAAGLLDAVPRYGPVNVTVSGRLKTGQPFYGQGTIVLSRLLGPRLR